MALIYDEDNVAKFGSAYDNILPSDRLAYPIRILATKSNVSLDETDVFINSGDGGIFSNLSTTSPQNTKVATAVDFNNLYNEKLNEVQSNLDYKGYQGYPGHTITSDNITFDDVADLDIEDLFELNNMEELVMDSIIANKFIELE